MSPTDSRMFIHFDPNKIMLPPLFVGPSAHNVPPTAQQMGMPRESRGVKRKRSMTSTLPMRFNKFEKELVKTAQNEHDEVVTKDLKNFENRDQTMRALRDCFKQSQNVNFAASYRTQDPGVSHKQRIQTITHEIWKVTGYRFTVKDHPRTKDGHKTRLWCSQDEAHKSKPSKYYQSPRTSGDGIILAKARFPCRSGLLISSRNDDQPDVFVVIIRMHHHFAHEAYYDHTLPPEMTQSIWEKIPPRHNDTPQPPYLSLISPESSIVEASRSENGSSDYDPEPPMNTNQQHRNHGKSPCLGLLHVQQPEIVPSLAPDAYQERMRQHIANIRDFCDGLEYQLPFNDFRLLDVLEREGGPFLRLIYQCLEVEGRLKSSDNTISTSSTIPLQRSS